MKNKFLVIDLVSGSADGHYATKCLADSALTNLQKRYKTGNWVTVEIVTNPDGHYLSDDNFHSVKLKD